MSISDRLQLSITLSLIDQGTAGVNRGQGGDQSGLPGGGGSTRITGGDQPGLTGEVDPG